MTEDFDVPEGTVFKDLSGLSDDEIAACFSLDVRSATPMFWKTLPGTRCSRRRRGSSAVSEFFPWLAEEGHGGGPAGKGCQFGSPGPVREKPLTARHLAHDATLVTAVPGCGLLRSARDSRTRSP
jgi:hypothetical protein